MKITIPCYLESEGNPEHDVVVDQVAAALKEPRAIVRRFSVPEVANTFVRNSRENRTMPAVSRGQTASVEIEASSRLCSEYINGEPLLLYLLGYDNSADVRGTLVHRAVEAIVVQA